MFQDLSQPDSIIILIYLVAAFALGALTFLLLGKKKKKQPVEKSAVAVPPSESAIQELNEEVTKLKQAHFFLSKDYEMALKAMQSLREQAEEMQMSLVGNVVNPRSGSDLDVNTARQKLKRYVEAKLKTQSAKMSISAEAAPNQEIGRISPIDNLDEELVIILAELIKD